MNQHQFKRMSLAVVIMALISIYVACSDSAEFKGQAKNAAASSPSCTVELTGQSITLGQTIKATLKSSATGVSSSTLNNIKADLGKPVDLTPTSEGVFKIEGALQNSAGSGTCQATVNVRPAPQPAPIAPSCSLALTRQSPSSGTCNAVISSTGGPIVVSPSVTGSAAMTPAGNGWTTTVPCSTAGATITAQVTGENNVVRTCSKSINAIPPPQCTINPNYNPEAVGCEINVKNTNSIWWTTEGFDSLVSAFSDSSASWISPPASTTNTQGRLICPKIDQTNQLIFVSHITITQAGNYTLEAIIDDQGLVWLWPEGDPTREIPITPLPIQTKNLTAGNYVVIVKAVDTGAASGMVLSIKNSAGTVIHRTHAAQNRSDSWCIFRTDSTVDPKTFVPEAARCRKCFGAP